jgi:hypothetical protein
MTSDQIEKQSFGRGRKNEEKNEETSEGFSL